MPSGGALMTLFSSYLISRYSAMGTFECLGGMAFVYTLFPSILEFVSPAWRVFLFSLILFSFASFACIACASPLPGKGLRVYGF
jgi:hypothetical protein